MIVVLCDRLSAAPEKPNGAFSLSPGLDLLSRPYLDRLAGEYRGLGAREIVWAGSTGDGLFAAGRRDRSPWQLIDHAKMRDGEVRHGETVLIADIRMWPGDETRRAFRKCRRSHSDLTAFVRPCDGEDYSEIIEPFDDGATGYNIKRCYQQALTVEESFAPVALMARPKSLGSTWDELLDVASSGDQDGIAAFVSEAQRVVIDNPRWIETADQYLVLAKQLLADGDVREPEARMIGENVWAMPGASVHLDSAIEGPVFLGRDCWVSRGARIAGPVVVGDSAQIGEDCFVGESVLLKDAFLPPKTRVWRAVVGAGLALEEEKGTGFGLLGEESCRHRLLAVSRLRFGTVVVPSRQPLRRCKHRVYPVIKRAMDICGAIVGLGLTLPLYPFIAIAIQLM